MSKQVKDYVSNLLEEEELEPKPAPKKPGNTKKDAPKKAIPEKSAIDPKNQASKLLGVRIPLELLEDYKNLSAFTGYTIQDLVIRALTEWSGYTETEAKRKELRKLKKDSKNLL